MTSVVDDLKDFLAEQALGLADDASYRRLAHAVLQRMIYITHHNAGDLFVSRLDDVCRLLPAHASVVVLGDDTARAERMLKDPAMLRQLIQIDPCDGELASYKNALKRLRGYPGRALHWRLHSQDALDLIGDRSLDMVFVSTLTDVDLICWADKVRGGGVLASVGVVPDAQVLIDAGFYLRELRATRDEELTAGWFGLKLNKPAHVARTKSA